MAHRPEYAELDAYRLSKDWTWAELSAAMGRAGITMPLRTLHYLLRQAPADAKPHDRTLYKIRQFLKIVRAAERRRATRRKAQRAAA